MSKLWLPGDSDFALSQREPNLLLPGKKPVGPVEIDWSNPLTRNLYRDVFLGHSGAIDLVSKSIYPKGTGDPVIAPTDRGLALYSEGPGSKDYIDFLNSADFLGAGVDGTTTHVSFEVLVRVHSYATRGVIFRFGGSSGDPSCHLTAESVGGGNTEWYFSVSTYSGNQARSSDYSAGEWAHVVGVFDGSYNRIYVNGVQGTPAVETWVDFSQEEHFLGAGFVNYNREADCEIAYFRYWRGRALTQFDVDQLYREQYGFYRSANSAPYLIGLPEAASASTSVFFPGDSDFALAMREPNLLVPGKKPVGSVQIDWRNPLASSLTAVALPDPGGVGEYTKNGFELAEFYGTGFKVRPEPGGIALSSDTTTNSSVRLEHVTSSSHVSPWTPSTGVTAVIVSARNGTQGGNCPLFSANAPSTSPYYGWGFYLSGLSDDVTFIVQTTSGYDGSAQVTESTTWPPGDVRVHVGTWDGATIRLYRNGVQQGSTAKSGASIYYPSGFDIGVSLGSFYNYSGGPRGFVGDIYIAMVFDRALSAAEVAEISRNPYQILKPANATPYLIGLPGGATAPTLSLPGVTNVQATQATPQVTLAF